MASPPAPPRASRARGLVAILGVAILLVSVVATANLMLRPEAAPQGAVGLTVGSLAPDFAIPDVNGTVWNLSAHRGEVVLLDFMGVRCSSCIAEMQEGSLQSAYRNDSSRGLAILSVDVGTTLGTKNATEAWRFVHGVGVDGSRWEPGTWPIALDNQRLALTYESQSMLPMKYLIDRSGRIVWSKLGLTSPAEIEGEIAPLLA